MLRGTTQVDYRKIDGFTTTKDLKINIRFRVTPEVYLCRRWMRTRGLGCS